jgi:N-formylglutamate amidohydrolase
MKSILLHIPHSSTEIPAQWRRQIVLDDDNLARELLLMTDAHTERLFDLEGVSRIVFPVSRLLVDPERFPDDGGEPMAERGMGVIYTKTANGEVLRDEPDASTRVALLNEYYHPHHAKLSAAAEQIIERHGSCLIVDCHSFPSRSLPYERQPGDALRPEICIGTDDFHTPKELSEKLMAFFGNKGYGVALNIPFAGALTPMKLYRQDPRLRSIMIEVRRDLYMDEETGSLLLSFERIKRHIAEGIERVW